MRKFVFIIVFLSVLGKSQVQVHGKVEDEFGFALSDVLVYVDGFSTSTYTNLDGLFSFEIPEGNYNLVFRKDEFLNEVVIVNATQKYVEIQLRKTDLVQLDEAHTVQMSEQKWQEYYKIFNQLFLG